MNKALLLALALIAIPPVSVEAQEEKDLERTRALAEQGNAFAQSNLAFMYYTGTGVPRDAAEAVRWYRLAAEQGVAIAQYALGYSYANGQGLPEDDAEAVRWYRLAAEQGDARAQSNLGYHYTNGEGVPKDYVLAYMWYNLAAAQGHDLAQRNKALTEQRMTRAQINEAQRLSREWFEAHPPDGN